MKYKLLEGRPAKKLATPDKKLVVEGFPRSGNTFLSDFILVTQPKGFAFAHHTHLAENVLMGVDNGVPAIVLVRNPVDAISSFVVYSDKSISFAAKKWLTFYQKMTPFTDTLLLVSFDTITQNPMSILEAANQKFSLTLDLPKSLSSATKMVEQRISNRSQAMANRENEALRKDLVKTSCLPTPERNVLKQKIIADVVREVECNELIFNLYNQLMVKAI